MMMKVIFCVLLALIMFSSVQLYSSAEAVAPIASDLRNTSYFINGLNKWARRTGAVCELMGILGFPCPGPDALPGDNEPLDISTGTFLLNFSVGDTHQKVTLIADTTMDMSFMLCQPCRDCSIETKIDVYNSTQSATFRKYTCIESKDCLTSQYTVCSRESCTYNYNGYPSITSNGFLATDTFFWSNINDPVHIVFGCGTANTGYYGNSVGYIGLGRGSLSFVSQLNVSLFSYCLSADPSYSNFFFGSEVRSLTTSGGSTNFLENRHDPILYYVNMTGISIGGKHVSMPSTAYLPQPDGSGGMVIDSTSSLTLLEESAYMVVKNEFIKEMRLPQADALMYDLDLCFSISSEKDDVAIPGLTLHFDGADMNPKNYFMKDVTGEVVCLTILPAKGISILGNLMQMDTHMIFDIGSSEMRFESVNCRSLSKI